MDIKISTPQNIANKTQDVSFDNDKVQILYEGKWYDVCSEEIFQDWLENIYDLSEYSNTEMICHDHRDQYQTKVTFIDWSEAKDSYYNLKEVKKFIHRADPIFFKFELVEDYEKV